MGSDLIAGAPSPGEGILAVTLQSETKLTEPIGQCIFKLAGCFTLQADISVGNDGTGVVRDCARDFLCHCCLCSRLACE